MKCFLILFIPISNDSDIWSSFYEFERKEVRHFLGDRVDVVVISYLVDNL